MIDVVIVGAGPAGLSAAIACAEHGLHVKIIDEFPKPGGRLLGQLHEEPDGTWWNGIEETDRIQDKIKSHDIEIERGASVYNIEHQSNIWVVYTTQGTIETPSLLLATGAAETPAPVPGWTLPGVMSIGAAQVMANVHRVRPGENGMIIGINVLSVAIARELKLAGVHIEGLVLPGINPLTQNSGNPSEVMNSMLRVADLAPSKFIRFGSKLLKGKGVKKTGVTFYPKKGMKIWEMPIQLRRAAVEIYGEQQVEGVRVADIQPNGEPILGSEKNIPVDFVCIAGGLYPLVELAAVSGCPFQFISSLGGHVPVHNERMQTPVGGLYVSGNITGIESAKVAMAQGTVAGLSIAVDRGLLTKSSEDKLQNAFRDVEITRENATIQFHPHIQEGRIQMQQFWENHLQRTRKNNISG